MILLVGTPTDSPLRSVADELRRLDAPHAVLDVHRPGTRVVHRWRPGHEAVVTCADDVLDLAEVDAAYLRPHPSLPPARAPRDVLAAVLAWADLTDGLVVNRPTASTLNTSKPAQLRAIAECGFRIPRTIVTTTADDVGALRAAVGEVVYKSTGPVRSIVQRLEPARLGELEALAACPTQFQEYIRGRDVRVHVIGTTVHALLVESGADDYRYARSTAERATATPFALPPEIEQRSLAMVERMGLVFAGIDLRQSDAGEWFCLEVNPSPGFTFYERIGGIRLAPLVADLLRSPT